MKRSFSLLVLSAGLLLILGTSCTKMPSAYLASEQKTEKSLTKKKPHTHDNCGTRCKEVSSAIREQFAWAK